MGPAASAENIVRVAKKAEELGYETLWVTERLLFPASPRSPYPASPDGSLPDVYKTVLDPVESLTYVAAQTSKIGLGTSVLDSPYYNPVMLARRLTTLDVLSNGRLRLGMGLGWSEDEYEASGAAMTQKGKRADEFIQSSRRSGRMTQPSSRANSSSSPSRRSSRSRCRSRIRRSTSPPIRPVR
jgi:alkanesulfonate monooxygenase SsuD/methylene tetrahydromethanopterin reductase-like flavin-dependent oxidoreductase (luciferase family)